MKRRLATILVGDVVGYSAMMEADEEGTAARIAELTTLVCEKVEAREGRVFKTMGDAVLADFASPLNALRCAVELRGALAEMSPPLQMRFGLHLADIIESGEDLIGDGVNGRPAFRGQRRQAQSRLAGRFSSRCDGIRRLFLIR
jgi:adenylate cyclase